jgi:hypothetical protein
MAPGSSECAAELTLNGIPAEVRLYASEYADCINSADGSPENIRNKCADIRRAKYETATESMASSNELIELERTFLWLDKMITERSYCHTQLKVK